MRSDTFILLVTQKNASDDDPSTEAIYSIGTLASVLQLLKLPDGTVKVLVEGAGARARSRATPTAREFYEADAGGDRGCEPATRSKPKRWPAPWSTSSKVT